MRRTNRAKQRLLFYSGGQEKRNARLHRQLIDLCPRKRGVRMTYVPFCSENCGTFFARFKRRYRAYGAEQFDCLPADDPNLESGSRLERRIRASDIIYLAGGNTFYFLFHLRRSGLLPALRRFGRSGGVLAGLSAGALLLTPHIGLAGYPDFDRDENQVGLRTLRALDLVRFEFFPHYRHAPRLRTALRTYSRRAGHVVYACRDGSGLVVDGDRFTAQGDVFVFSHGHEWKIGP